MKLPCQSPSLFLEQNHPFYCYSSVSTFIPHTITFTSAYTKIINFTATPLFLPSYHIPSLLRLLTPKSSILLLLLCFYLHTTYHHFYVCLHQNHQFYCYTSVSTFIPHTITFTSAYTKIINFTATPVSTFIPHTITFTSAYTKIINFTATPLFLPSYHIPSLLPLHTPKSSILLLLLCFYLHTTYHHFYVCIHQNRQFYCYSSVPTFIPHTITFTSAYTKIINFTATPLFLPSYHIPSLLRLHTPKSSILLLLLCFYLHTTYHHFYVCIHQNHQFYCYSSVSTFIPHTITFTSAYTKSSILLLLLCFYLHTTYHHFYVCIHQNRQFYCYSSVSTFIPHTITFTSAYTKSSILLLLLCFYLHTTYHHFYVCIH